MDGWLLILEMSQFNNQVTHQLIAMGLVMTVFKAYLILLLVYLNLVVFSTISLKISQVFKEPL